MENWTNCKNIWVMEKQRNGNTEKNQGNARNKNSTVKEIKNAFDGLIHRLTKKTFSDHEELSVEICKRKNAERIN